MARTQTMGAAILGAWLAATLLMWFVAAGSFSTVERVLRASDSRFNESTRLMSRDQTRSLLRYFASEINRNCFRAYGWGQVVLGGLLLFLLLRQTPRDATALVIAAALLGLVLVLTLIVTPEIVRLGRSLDFLPRDPAPPGMGRFRTLHAAFTALDGVKFMAGLALLVRWVAKS
jgi:uncharacterized protein DUF4149